MSTEREVSVPEFGGTLFVTLVDEFGCAATSEIDITLDLQVEIFYPTVFSPNGDGNNDIFFVHNSGGIEMIDEIKVFDRYGNLVFDQRSMPFSEAASGWDGRFNGNFVETGVYVFMLRYTTQNNEINVFKGTITVVR